MATESQPVAFWVLEGIGAGCVIGGTVPDIRQLIRTRVMLVVDVEVLFTVSTRVAVESQPAALVVW